MQIIRATAAGFCSGVKGALKTAEQALQPDTDPGGREAAEKRGKVFTLGPIVHNRLVVEQLNERGISVAENLEELRDVPGAQLVIRSHGVGPGILQQAEAAGIRVIDATCPLVKRVQQLAKSLAEDGFRVVIIGDPKHPEVTAVLEWTEGQGMVVADAEEARQIAEYPRIGIVCQTTQIERNYRATAAVLLGKGREVRAFNTICPATRERQEAALGLAQTVEAMVVVGGFDSANTRKLVELCAGAGIPVYPVETAAQLEAGWFAQVNRVGVTAGASTPEWIIEEVIVKMSEFEQTDVNQAEQAELEKEKLPEVPENTAETAEAAPAAAPEAAAEPAETTPADEEAEIVETMEDQLTKDMPDLRTGNVIKGKVVQVKLDEILVDVGGKSEGVVPLKELSVRNITSASDAVQVGDEIEVLVVRAENDEGTMVLSKRRADQIKAWTGLEEAFQNGTELAGEVVQVVKGGLLVDVGARGFVPASLIERGYVSNLENYLGKVLRLRVIDLDRNKNKVVLSQKAILEEEYEEARKELWNSIEAGQQRKGTVRRLTNFGAFVDVGGADGLLHISEMSWTHINHPSEVVQENEEMEVYVLAVDKDKQRISLGLKQILRSPWENAADKYQAGQIVSGKVVRTVPFGAFVQIEPGVEGLVHISQLASYRVGRVEEIVNAGDVIQIKILDIKPQEQRMSLSLSQAREEQTAAEEQKLVEDYQESQKAEAEEANDASEAGEAGEASDANVDEASESN